MHILQTDRKRLLASGATVLVLLLVFCAVLVLRTVEVQAASRRPAFSSQANLGVILVNSPRGLFVAQVTTATPLAGLRIADEITAVNGRRVATATALLNRLAATGNAGTLTIIRDGRRLFLTSGAPASPAAANAGQPSAPKSGGGIINPSQFVMTSQGAMHKDVAARLGLEGTPLPSPPRPSDPDFFPRRR